MTDAFHSVARGLRVAHAGFLLTCGGAVSAVILAWLVGEMGWRDDPVRVTLWVAFWLNVAIGVGGVVTGIVGRVKCLNAPPEYPAVRGRAIAAVMLEGSGWLSGFAGIGLTIATGYKLLPQEPVTFIVLIVGGVLSGLMLLGGRVMFLRFLRVLARVVEDKTTARRARLSLALFIAVWAVGLFGWGVGAGGSAINEQEVTTPVAVGVFILVGMSGMVGLVLYDRTLGGLTKSVRDFGDAQRNEEEERYRSREEPDEADEPADVAD